MCVRACACARLRLYGLNYQYGECLKKPGTWILDEFHRKCGEASSKNPMVAARRGKARKALIYVTAGHSCPRLKRRNIDQLKCLTWVCLK